MHLPYSAIVDRAPLRRGSTRVIVWTVLNVEHWGLARHMPRRVLPPPMGGQTIPDTANWAWHEYGMRIGFWRLHGLLAASGITPTLATNGSVCSEYPRIAEAAAASNYEFMGHGFIQAPMAQIEDEEGAMRRTIDAIREVTGVRPRGWESPGLTATDHTLDLLAKTGFDYVADLPVDDQPCEIGTSHGPLVAMPYTVELNDVVVSAVQQHSSDEILRRGLDQFSRLYAEGADSVRIMTISLHPYLSGVPHRIGYIEQLYAHLCKQDHVEFMTGAEIVDWWRPVAPACTRTGS